jgi:hypothetical protein
MAEQMKPQRIQRKRTKGWRMPDGAVYVGRPTIWGNPYSVKGAREAGYIGTDAELAAMCVGEYRSQAIGCLPIQELRGKDLACWCPIDQPCHADVLLELANAPICAPLGRN